MTMWIVILAASLLITVLALFYLSTRIGKFSFFRNLAKDSKYTKIINSAVVVIIFALIGIILNFVNAVVCTLYFAIIWLISDFIFYCCGKIFRKSSAKYYSGFAAIAASVLILSVGWYLDHHVAKTEYELFTAKNITPLKIAMFADSHLGTTFNAKGLASHLQEIQKQNPDLLVIVGDFVDDGTTKQDMLDAVKLLGKFKSPYGVYFVFGNHDKGYYGAERRGFSVEQLVKSLEKNNIKVVKDQVLKINDDVYLIGRLDRSIVKELHGHRKSMQELVTSVDQTKYSIVLDHQPTDYENQTSSGVDLVLSGHTHGGQLFPFNYLVKWIGENDSIYGLETRANTNFIVTSGISDWAIKFKTGTKSEYVIVNVKTKD